MYALQSFHSGKEQFNEIIKSHFKAITNHYYAFNVKVSKWKKKKPMQVDGKESKIF